MKNLIIILFLLSVSCSPLKRHNRIVKNHPYVHTVDSIKLIDTIRLTTDKVSTDTLISIKFDTVTMTKENLTVRLIRVNDSIYVNGECDTIFIDKIIERTIPIVHTTKKPFNWYWILFGLFVIGLFWVFRITRR